MNALMKTPALIGGTVLAAATIALTAGLAPAAAAPAPSGARLYIYTDPANPATHRVTVEGVFPMSEADAVGFLNNMNTGDTGGMTYMIVGDDPGGDGGNVLVTRSVPGVGGTPEEGRLMATAEGIHYICIFNLPRNVLDEDDNLLDDADEIYAEVNFHDADGEYRSQSSPVIAGEF